MNIHIPGNLEVVWGLLRPIEVTGRITKIITCCFYCPPKSTKKAALIDHMTITLQSLLTTYPQAGILISGDKNDLGIDRLLTLDPSLRQIVNKPTLRAKILDIILTNMPSLYKEPEIVQPIPVDNPAKGGVPSDHSGVIVSPLSDASKPAPRKKICRIIRPITSSSIRNLGQVLVNEKWKFLDPSLPSTDLVELFQYYTGQILELFCPTKMCFIRPDQKPWVTESLKLLKRKVQREYYRHGKSIKYSEMNQQYKEKLVSEMHKYKQKLEDEVLNGERNSSYAAIRRLGARPGDPEPSAMFTLQSHADKNLTARQSADIIADHFSSISQEYQPISIANFPPKMRTDLAHPNMSVVPCLTECEVYRKICRSKKPNSHVPGDLPKRIVKEFSCELTTPITIVYNSILKTLKYPRQWVQEHQVPIPKVYPPSSEDELRNISKTAYFSKVFESFLADWLMPIVEPCLDPCQYGLKGSSVTHYLFKLLKFIHQYLDLKQPHAVVVALIDLNKAFNRISHEMVVQDFYDMKVPPWLLLILISYLTERTMILTYNGTASSPRSLPGSSSQGAFLGLLFFIVKYNGASLRPLIQRINLSQEYNAKFRTCIRANCHKHIKDTHALYIDDLSEAQAIDLKKETIIDPIKRPFPLNYHERTQHVLPNNNPLHKRLDNLEQFTLDNQMKISESKSKIMIFNK